MINEKRFVDKIWISLFYMGQFIILIASFYAFDDLPMKTQPVAAITSSFVYFISSFLFVRIPNKPENFRNHHIRLLWIGIAEIILAILFWTVIKPRTEFALWGRGFNLMFGMIGMVNAYSAIMFYMFPKIFHNILTPTPNPLSEFPGSVQEIIDKGRKWVNGSVGITISVFFLIGVIGNTVLTIKFNDESNDFFLSVVGLGFLIGFALGTILTFKWQKWARKSGISEEQLKTAARLAGLWWPK
jgi:hypothetical protein